MGGVYGDDESDRNAHGLKRFCELQRAASPHRVADEDDRSGILPITLNSRRSYQAANCKLIHVGLYTGAFDFICQSVHSARKNRTESPSE